MTYGEIYVVTCLVNGKQYVGQTTCGVDERWRGHCEAARGGRGRLLAKAIRKYGPENFRVETVDSSPDQAGLDAKEIALIASLSTQVPGGYNLAEGGSRGKHAPETRAKMSAAKKGRTLSPAHIEKIRLASTGRKLTDEEKAKISAANKGRVRSAETRAKQSETRRERGLKPTPQAHEAARLVHKTRQKTPQEIEGTRCSNRERVWTPEMREKNRLAHLGQPRSPETIAKWKLAMGRKKRETTA